MTRCNATAELMDADMQIIPGITLMCELEAGHDVTTKRFRTGGLTRVIVEGDVAPSLWRYLPVEHQGTEHAYTFRWADVTAAELAEVLDPDESFDLEVDIAPEAVLEQQQNNAIANGEAVDERDYPRDLTVCLVCGDEVERANSDGSRYVHRVSIRRDHEAAVHLVNSEALSIPEHVD